jgi:hypothetical protein
MRSRSSIDRRQGFDGISDAGDAYTASDYRLRDDAVPRTPKVPAPKSAGLSVEGDDLFIFMAIDPLIEFDNHPHSMKVRPGLQQDEISYFEGNAYQGGSMHSEISSSLWPKRLARHRSIGS